MSKNTKSSLLSAKIKARIRTGIALTLSVCMVIGTVSPLSVRAEEDQGNVYQESATVAESVSEETNEALAEDVSGDDFAENEPSAEEETLIVLDELSLGELSPDGDAMVDGDYEYELKDSRYTITKYTGNEEDVTIPKELGGKKITAIAKGAFRDNASIKNLTIPEGIVKIGGAAFLNCSALETANIPASLIECGYEYISFGYSSYYAGPFGRCDKLKAVTFGSGLETIPAYLFRSCTGLESIAIPDSVKTIGANAFDNCTSLQEITIPGNVKTVGKCAFRQTTSLTKVVCSEGVEKIGEYAFNECTALKEAKLADTITYLGGAAFLNCSALETANIPGSLTECGYEYIFSSPSYDAGPFGCCNKLKTVTFGSKLQTIPGNLFRMCTGLESVTLPASVKSIGNYAFADCTSLKKSACRAA